MDKLLSESLTQSIKLSEEEISFLRHKLKPRKLKRGEIILNASEVCSSVYFISKGSFYEYHLDEDYNIRVINLYTIGDWMLNHQSFTSRKPSQNAIEAFEGSSVYELTIESIHGLIESSQSFLKFGKLLEEATNRLVLFDGGKSATQKYEYILTRKPLLIQKFPLAMIASYLKISPETLSRVRSRIT